ncbi:MAG: hypothetical protein K2X81_20140, partial [Candidatus Obscuribacterales bacterium]|nr:hypothetical protein [Candidatus Obscuribacterales bacterium]
MMITDFFASTQLLALFAPLVAVTLSYLLPKENWKLKALLFGHGTAFAFALIALFAILNKTDIRILTGISFFQVKLDLATSFLLAGMTFISFIVLAFGERYMSGDKSRLSFLQLLS